MSDFVNDNKRDPLLPPGGKDLADAWHRKQRQNDFEQTIHTRHNTAGRLSDLERHFERVYKLTSLATSLFIVTPGKFRFHVVNHQGQPIDHPVASVVVEEGGDSDGKMRAFFTTHNLELPVPLPKVAAGIVIYRIIPMPEEAKLLAGLASDLLRRVGNASESTELRFEYDELVLSAEG